ncbi:unnamed protein product [Pleuronectes platessa]|uniref:Uncharacterized protein n=1 Tax=Pleuronectes platessa TaxID=8262 RepID=A0A9N7Y5C2_PLEPL|nr:unnamed protein product [Pleuronectes platessa]
MYRRNISNKRPESQARIQIPELVPGVLRTRGQEGPEDKKDQRTRGTRGQEDKRDQRTRGQEGPEDKRDQRTRGTRGQEGPEDKRTRGTRGQEGPEDQRTRGTRGQEGPEDQTDMMQLNVHVCIFTAVTSSLEQRGTAAARCSCPEKTPPARGPSALRSAEDHRTLRCFSAAPPLLLPTLKRLQHDDLVELLRDVITAQRLRREAPVSLSGLCIFAGPPARDAQEGGDNE